MGESRRVGRNGRGSIAKDIGSLVNPGVVSCGRVYQSFKLRWERTSGNEEKGPMRQKAGDVEEEKCPSTGPRTGRRPESARGKERCAENGQQPG